jgi:exoribonuclease-2
MGLTKNPAVVVNLLIGMGVFPCHVNVDLLRMKNLVEFTKEHNAAVEQLCGTPPVDPDLENRVDLTAMKVYTIDSDDADEIDDGLSATRLGDGRIKVWIHIADPTRWLPLDHVLTREAESRGTSIYLPTGTIPMFPMELAGGHMSLRQGHNCCAITVSVVLSDDGRILCDELHDMSNIQTILRERCGATFNACGRGARALLTC